MTGVEIPIKSDNSDQDVKHVSVGELYFRADRLKSLNGHTQTLAGFEKIRTVGKGKRLHIFYIYTCKHKWVCEKKSLNCSSLLNFVLKN